MASDSSHGAAPADPGKGQTRFPPDGDHTERQRGTHKETREPTVPGFAGPTRMTFLSIILRH